MIAATRKGFAFWESQCRTPSFITDPEADRPDIRLNDGAVDRQGRFWLDQ
jgi:L-arabinonolactonase